MNKYLVKVALYIHQYEHKKHGKKWVAEGKAVPEGYIRTGVSFYKRKGQNMTKKADEKVRPNQQEALDHLEETGGIVLHHSTGSGKTNTFLKAIERAQAKDKTGRALVVAPASLQTNIDKEIKKHKVKIDRDRLDVRSYEWASRHADSLAKKHYSIAVADEAHKLRNTGTQRVQKLREIFENADQRILATATGNYNSISDISPLVNIAAGGDKILPEKKKDFENKYLRTIQKPRNLTQFLTGQESEEEQVLVNRKDLKSKLQKYISYYDARDDESAKEHFPSQTEETIDVAMSPEQERLYKYIEGRDLPIITRLKIRNNLPMTQKEKQNLNAFSTGVRQVSTSMRHLSSTPEHVPYTPKVEKAVERLKERMKGDKNFRAIVYSNYLGTGVHEYSRKLQQEGIPHTVYTGELSREEKDKAKDDYNSGKVPVMLVSSAGGEGLDLKGTKLVQVLEPHFNKQKITQVTGRANRFDSHADLPKEERHVHVEHYRTVHPKSKLFKTPYSIDRYLSENSDDKQQVFDQVKALMKPDGSEK